MISSANFRIPSKTSELLHLINYRYFSGRPVISNVCRISDFAAQKKTANPICAASSGPVQGFRLSEREIRTPKALEANARFA